MPGMITAPAGVLAGLGIVLLLMGRRLFWLFVAAVGFVAGLQAADLLLGAHPLWMRWTAGLLVGIGGALLAWFFQKLAVAVGGFVAGGAIALQLAHQMGMSGGMAAAFIGGVAGAVAVVLLFDWALIVLSAAVGAAFLLDAVGWRLPYAAAGFILLTAAGVAVQARALAASRRPGA